MCPEAEITARQANRVREWIKNNRVKSDFFMQTGGIWEISTVKGEPIVIQSSLIATEMLKGKLYCSDGQAKELGKAGIVTFSESTQEEAVSSSIPPGINWLGRS